MIKRKIKPNSDEEMARIRVAPFHHPYGEIEGIPFDEVVEGVNKENSPETEQKIKNEFLDEDGNVDYDKMDKQYDGFYALFPNGLSKTE